MAEVNSALQEAEILYKNGHYEDATKKCIEILKTGECWKETNLLWAKSYLFLIPITKTDDFTKQFYDAIGRAAATCETFEEFFAIEHEIAVAINEWERYWFNRNMEFLEQHPTLDNWGTFIKTWTVPTLIKIQSSIYVRNQLKFKELEEESGEDIEQLCEKYEIEQDNELTDEEKGDLYYSVGCKIFSKTVEIIEEYKYSSSEALMTLKDVMIQRLYLIPLMIQTSIEQDTPTELERLKQYANILNYVINAAVYPNGKKVILASSNDTQVLELKKTYNRIKELDDSFTIPEIVKPEPTPAQTTTSGGCYVATAVYGSYDCPQVWTLRRYRDDTLAETWYGRAFIKTYYAISPTLVKWFGHTTWFKKMWKGKLDRMVADLNADGVENTPYEDKSW